MCKQVLRDRLNHVATTNNSFKQLFRIINHQRFPPVLAYACSVSGVYHRSFHRQYYVNIYRSPLLLFNNVPPIYSH